MNQQALEDAIAIGTTLLSVNAAIEEGKIAWQNANMNQSKYDFYETTLFKTLDAHRSYLRQQLLRMG